MAFEPHNPDALIATLARLFVPKAHAAAVAVLARAKASIEQVDHDNWDGGQDFFSVTLEVPAILYAQLGEEGRVRLEKAIAEELQPLMRRYPSDHIRDVFIVPEMSGGADWQTKAKAWVEGKGVTNQGRVRSDNIAGRSFDGLLFRAQPEINLYQALKSAGVSFAPLPVFVRAGRSYRRIEPDFIIVKDGMVMAVEVDGDTVHHETPPRRTTD